MLPLLKKEEAPICVTCHTAVTIKYILIECADLTEIKYSEEESVHLLFQNVSLKRIPERN